MIAATTEIAPKSRKKTASQKASKAEKPVTKGKGIDLSKRGLEVRKILVSKFHYWISSGGYSLEDIVQEVYLGIEKRNHGRCPFDESKSSFGHYVYMVCNCVLANYHRKHHKRLKLEQVPLGYLDAQSDTIDDTYRIQETPLDTEPYSYYTAVVDDDTSPLAQERLVSYLETRALNPRLAKQAVEVLPLLLEGYNKSEISKKKAWNINKTNKVVSYLRETAERWYAE
ncbi:MAG: hypothetical protein OEY01_03885 [Desulfobulbaceae bacterium]|nr:hypothetical protein [Desulfobulbaceae bacterium]